MDPNKAEIAQSTTELKHLGVLKKIMVRVVVLLSIVYDFAKENYDELKSSDVYEENAGISAEEQKLKDLVVDIIVFLDDKFDKYAPSFAKTFVADFQSLIYKTNPIVKIIITISQTVITPLITTTIFLLQITKFLIQNITTTTTTESTSIQKGLTTVLPSSSLVDTTQSVLQNSLDTTKSLVSDTILQKGTTDLVNQVQDVTKSLVGGIPLMGNVAQSLVTNPTDLANQIVNTTDSLVNKSPVLEVVNSAAQNSLDIAKSLVPDSILQTGPDLANQAQDITKSLAGSVPLVSNVAESLVTNPTDLANQIVNTTDSLVNENPVLEVVNSAAQNSLDIAKSLVPDTILQTGPDLANQAQDITKSILAGSVPLVSNVAESLVTNPTDLANQIVNTTDSLVNENPVLEVVNSTAQNSLDIAKSLVPDTILQTGPDLANQAQDITKSLAGSVPLVSNIAESLVTNPTDLASQIVNTTDSLVNENPVLGVVNSAAQNSLDSAKSLVPDTILQTGPDLANQAQDISKSVAGSIPLVNNVAESLVTNPTDLANQIVNTTDSLVNENPILGVVNSTAQNSLDTANKGFAAVGNLFGLNKK